MAGTDDLPETCEVAIIGGAVIGSAAAYYLTRMPGFRGRVVVIEKDPTYRDAATPRSAGGIRQQFSTPENILISQFGLELLRNLMAEFGPEADVNFRERGYLMLASAEGSAQLEANVALQRSHGAKIAHLGPGELAREFPWLNPEGIAAAARGLEGEGWIDPWSLLNLFRKAARQQGAHYLEAEATGLDLEGERVDAVRLADGRRIRCRFLINAAGWCGAARVASWAGVALPIEARKRFVFVIDCRRADAALQQAPLVIDPTGVWVRPEGGNFITGLSPPEDADPPSDDFDVDHGWFETEIWPRLAERVPAFEELKVLNAWACHYDYNTFDQNVVLGAHPELTNLLFANGFSGHGIQQAPAIGRALAELIVHGGYRTLDLTRFGYARIAGSRPIREANVI